MVENTQSQISPLSKPEKIPVGSVDYFSDPNYLKETDQKLDDFGQEILNLYGEVPGVQEELHRQISTQKMSIRKAQAELLQKEVMDIYGNKLSEIGRYAKQGEFAKTYQEMAMTLSNPNVLAAIGADNARDLLRQKFSDYTVEKGNLYGTFPTPETFQALDNIIRDPGVRSIITTTALQSLQTKRGTMATALGSQYTPSEADKRFRILDTLKKQLKRKHGEEGWREHWKMTETEEQEYILLGDKGDNPFSDELTEREYRTTQAGKMTASNLFTKREVMEYESTGKIPTAPAKAKYLENIELATFIDDTRRKHTSKTGETIPLLTREETESIVLTGKLPTESEAKAREGLVQLMMDAGIPIDKQQQAIFIATGKYEASQLQTMQDKVRAIETIIKRPLAEPEMQRLFKIDKTPLVEVNLAQDEAIKSGVRAIEADIKSLTVAGKEARQMMTNITFFENALDAARASGSISTTGAFVKPILGITKVAEFLKEVFPQNPLFSNILKKLGDPALKETLDASSKRMVLFIAKYVGRITNLSLKFSRDSVPGILKTESGNRLIIALMKKQSSIDEGLARIGEKHTQAAVGGSKYGNFINAAGLKNPDYFTEKYAFIDANRAEDDPELENLFKQTQLEINNLPENKNKKPPPLKTLKDIVVKIPDRTNKDFQKYLKSKQIVWGEGMTYFRTWRNPQDGLTYFVFRNAAKEGFMVSTHWDDKNPITIPPPEEPIKVNEDTTPPPVKPDQTWFGVEDPSKLTVEDVMTASPDQITQFWNEVVAGNKAEIQETLGIPAEVLDEIETLYNEAISQ